MTRMPRVIAFDVNETLLDLTALDPLFGDVALRKRWFAQMLQIAFVGIITDQYIDFGAAQRGALEMMGLDVDPDEVGATMRSLPPHPDVAPALDRLHEGGLTLCSLTNSSLGTSTAQLTHAGIADRFEAILSADSVRRLKPAPEPYRHVAETFGVEIGDVTLVACHAWDCAGALAAGAQAAFVRRPGMVLGPVGPDPGIQGDDLGEVASLILPPLGS
jgi:2-haloacid dehalogenase